MEYIINEFTFDKALDLLKDNLETDSRWIGMKFSIKLIEVRIDTRFKFHNDSLEWVFDCEVI